ncbi:3'-5' exoribonuclease domain-containing protein [Mycobacterium sp. SMC-16]|uniref:3'-5' exoribonuclease domain-containing protein n=1 Tax=Mycobacterium sp. SMC-16 TaxID=3385967 RepID=UPI00390C66E0
MTIYCYDTEFIEDGHTIDLISIGIVCEDGREYYAVNVDCDFARICNDDWLWANVVPHLPTTKTDWDDPIRGRFGDTRLDLHAAAVKPKWVIANEVREFIVGGIKPMGQRDGEPFYASEDLPQLWAYYGAYDHVALAQLWGRMIDHPNLMPMFTHDLMQLIEPLRGFTMPKQAGDQHNALADARWNLEVLHAARRHGGAS